MPPVLTLERAQKQLDAQFGKGEIILHSYVNQTTKVLMTFPGYSVSRKLRPFDVRRCKTLAAVLGGKGTAVRDTLEGYQDKLDARFGKGVVVALTYSSAMKNATHLIEGVRVIRTPDRMLRGVKDPRRFLGGPHPNQIKPDDFKRSVESASGNRIEYVGTYRGWDKPHRLSCRRCSHVFVAARLSRKPKRVLCPRCDWTPTASSASNEWIKMCRKRYGIRIRNFKSKGGEKRLKVSGKSYQVDGYNHANKIVFEFHGKIWHGNSSKGSERRYSHPYSTLSDLELFRKTKARERALRKAGFTVVAIWDYQFRTESGRRRFFKRTDSILSGLLGRTYGD